MKTAIDIAKAYLPEIDNVTLQGDETPEDIADALLEAMPYEPDDGGPSLADVYDAIITRVTWSDSHEDEFGYGRSRGLRERFCAD
jgi:hypothetical protein